MAQIDFDSIWLKSKKSLDLEVEGVLYQEMQAAGEQYKAIFQDVLKSYGLPTSVEELGDYLSISDPEVHRYAGTGFFKGWYKRSTLDMEVTFGGDLYRPSLIEWKYGGVDNILMLMNEGYDYNEDRRRIVGYWHGDLVSARPGREGLHFIEKANRRAVREIEVLGKALFES